VHYGEDRLPVLSGAGVHVRLIAGEAFGARSPSRPPMAMLYADVTLRPARRCPSTRLRGARLYTVSGEIEIAGDRFGPGQLLVFRPGDRITIRAVDDARLMILGGEPMDGPRHIWWNFVSSRKERIDQAKADWSLGRFDSVPGESEFIPLPAR
jgi:redox-sensitive bicupin YhaK (pirin superfamily)